MLEYAEVYTNIERIQVCTLPLELQAGVDIEKIVILVNYLSMMLLIFVSKSTIKEELNHQN